MNEIWRDIEGYEGVYQISSFGRVRRILSHNKAKAGLIKPLKTKKYYVCRLCHEGKAKTFAIHIIVAKTFIGKNSCCPLCQSKFQVNHKDLNPFNNRSDNLEYVTSFQNNLHALKKRQKAQAQKLNEEKVVHIKKMIQSGITQRKISEQFGISESTVSAINCGRNWSNINISNNINI